MINSILHLIEWCFWSPRGHATFPETVIKESNRIAAIYFGSEYCCIQFKDYIQLMAEVKFCNIQRGGGKVLFSILNSFSKTRIGHNDYASIGVFRGEVFGAWRLVNKSDHQDSFVCGDFTKLIEP